MAPHPRLLYPYPVDPASCTTSCTPPCAFYLLCSYLLPPPPPSPPPLPPPLSLTTPTTATPGATGTPIQLQSSRLPLPLLLLAASLLAGSLLLLLSLLLHLLLRRLRHRHNNNIGTIIAAAATTSSNQNQDPHFVWYIRTVGLDERAIANITTWAYKGEGGNGVNGSCAVCLADFRDGEMLRLLPKCGHAFHLACIDTWLRARVSCPLCRAPVVLSEANVTTSEMENGVVGASENPASELPGLSLQSDHDEDGDHVYDSNLGGGERSRIGRRSASMGSVPLVALMLRQDIEERGGMEGEKLEFDQGSGSESREEEEDDNVKNGGLRKASLELDAVEIERSLSCNGTTFFLSRYGRARSSVLPSRSERDAPDVSR